MLRFTICLDGHRRYCIQTGESGSCFVRKVFRILLARLELAWSWRAVIVIDNDLPRSSDGACKNSFLGQDA